MSAGWFWCLLVSCLVCPVSLAEELKDIRGPVAIPGDNLWLWVCLAAGVAVILVLIYFKAWQKRTPAAPAIRKSPWEIALEELHALEREERSGEGQIKWFYSRLSEIVRVYIEWRFDIRAPEMTTEEFLDKVQASAALEDAQKQSLRDLLNASDLVKFAKSVPAREDTDEALRLARKFVEETRIVVPPAEAGQGQPSP